MDRPQFNALSLMWTGSDCSISKSVLYRPIPESKLKLSKSYWKQVSDYNKLRNKVRSTAYKFTIHGQSAVKSYFRLFMFANEICKLSVAYKIKGSNDNFFDDDYYGEKETF